MSDIVNVKRTTLKIRDLSRAVPFYERVLGLTKDYDNELTLGGRLLPGAAAGDKVRLVIMRGADTDLGHIGLLQWVNPKQDAPPVKNTLEFGQPVFVLNVPDADKVHAAALDFGCEMSGPPSEATYPGFDGATVYVRSLGVFDPDGHFFECNQRFTKA